MEQTSEQSHETFRARLKILCLMIVGSCFLDLIYYQPEKSVLYNVAWLSINAMLGFLIAYGLYKGKNWGRVLFYVMTALGLVGFLSFSEFSTTQQIIFCLNYVLLLYILFFLLKNKKDTQIHFSKSKTDWLVWILAFGGVVISIVVVIGLIGSYYLSKHTPIIEERVQAEFTTEGEAKLQYLKMCEKRVRRIEISSELEGAYCNCVGLNSDLHMAEKFKNKVDIKQIFLMGLYLKSIEATCLNYVKTNTPKQ